MTINEIQDQIIEEFGMFGDWMDKYEYIIDMGKKLPPLGDEFKTEDNLVRGCQSRVWLTAEKASNGTIHFEADSDALISKGIIALLVRIMTDQPAEDIVNNDLYFIDQIGLKEHLSPNRSNGLVSMVKQMKLYGVAFLAKS
jgi:cysteine desulfuration protein SufE